jgi:hypothetical protein
MVNQFNRQSSPSVCNLLSSPPTRTECSDDARHKPTHRDLTLKAEEKELGYDDARRG